MDKQLALEYHMATGIQPTRDAYIEWLEERIEKYAKKEKEVSYILFGITANEMCSKDTDAVERIIEEAVSFGLYLFTGDLEELISEADGWGSIGIITENEFNELQLCG